MCRVPYFLVLAGLREEFNGLPLAGTKAYRGSGAVATWLCGLFARSWSGQLQLLTNDSSFLVFKEFQQERAAPRRVQVVEALLKDSLEIGIIE